ncbi:unnamed protein product, partial [marine sediment metagenome]
KWESENSRILIVYSSPREKWDSVIMFPGLPTSPYFIQILFDGFGKPVSGDVAATSFDLFPSIP